VFDVTGVYDGWCGCGKVKAIVLGVTEVGGNQVPVEDTRKRKERLSSIGVITSLTLVEAATRR